jgi:hypothetical protein
MADRGGSGRAAVGKLTGAEKNDAKASLPAAAESTNVLDLLARFSLPNVRGGCGA